MNKPSVYPAIKRESRKIFEFFSKKMYRRKFLVRFFGFTVAFFGRQTAAGAEAIFNCPAACDAS